MATDWPIRLRDPELPTVDDLLDPEQNPYIAAARQQRLRARPVAAPVPTAPAAPVPQGPGLSRFTTEALTAPGNAPGPGAGFLREAPPEPSAGPPPAQERPGSSTVAPPSDGRISDTPSDHEQLGFDDPETERVIQRIKEIWPERDYLAEAEKRLGPYPRQDPGQGSLSPIALTALMLPALLGGSAGAQSSLAALEGMVEGQDVARQRYEGGFSRYREDLAKVADRLERTETERAKAVTPFVLSRADARLRAQTEHERTQILAQRYAAQQRHQDEQLAFEEFKWANPSAYQQMRAQLDTVHLQILDRHDRALEALAAGRQAEAQAYHHELLVLRGQEINLRRRAVDLAVQKATSPEAAFKVMGGLQHSIDTAMNDLTFPGTDPATKALIQEEIAYYHRALGDLQQRYGQSPSSSGAPSAGGPSGAGAAPPSIPLDPKAHTGRIVRDTQTGKRYRSDGTQWIEVP